MCSVHRPNRLAERQTDTQTAFLRVELPGLANDGRHSFGLYCNNGTLVFFPKCRQAGAITLYHILCTRGMLLLPQHFLRAFPAMITS